ncbi:DUF3105 domain-containing protein [Gandjariella thermophila]|uniref:DUF3105 domain-containing protein n=1 Tax=Gandjariella thermophila TaxID=1931992 RepID=A0A4D4J6T1_9PSEU|nr:DUF3105 domain-containing protein [Gandjariella thermophila]GDY32465.1 hypothetical protein GTS_40980 [Gandjariella thermophila]
MAGGRQTRGKQRAAGAGRRARSSASALTGRQRPWGMVIAVLAVLALAGGVFGYAYTQLSAKNAKQAAMARWLPSETNKDPSTQIPGVVKRDYPAGKHVTAAQRVAYDASPPFGGPHDGNWAACTGTVYRTAVRNENMVHALEHGAVWIAYNPDQVTGAALDTLKQKVAGQQFTMLSPYPGLDRPISVQSWGHQLKLDSATDPRLDEFVQSLRQNRYTTPEIGASCDALGPGQFDPDNPPPFDPSRSGPDAVPMSGGQEANNGR